MLGQRRKRQYTTAEEANHKCQKCGKFFHRRYNYRAHLATHDPNREYAHICQVDWCKKKFARKTDLTRHVQSVRLKFFFFFLCVLALNSYPDFPWRGKGMNVATLFFFNPSYFVGGKSLTFLGCGD
jgi:uncharacterized C2H2 Zn-finger protein